MKKIALFIVILLGLIACQSDEKKASDRLEKARQYSAEGSYNAAKLEIDSLRTLYPKAYKVIKQAIGLMHEVEYKEQTKTNAYCDSILIVLQKKAELLKSNFILDQDKEYQESGNWILKSQKVEDNIGRSYLRTGVSDNGDMYIASVYYGKSPIKHNAIRVATPDGLFAETLPIDFDGANNFSFNDGGMTTEVVNYAHKNENGVAGFIKLYGNQTLKVTYLGGKPHSIILDEKTKQAVRQTYELAQALSDIFRFNQEKRLSAAKIEYLKKKMTK